MRQERGPARDSTDRKLVRSLAGASRALARESERFVTPTAADLDCEHDQAASGGAKELGVRPLLAAASVGQGSSSNTATPPARLTLAGQWRHKGGELLTPPHKGKPFATTSSRLPSTRSTWRFMSASRVLHVTLAVVANGPSARALDQASTAVPHAISPQLRGLQAPSSRGAYSQELVGAAARSRPHLQTERLGPGS